MNNGLSLLDYLNKEHPTSACFTEQLGLDLREKYRSFLHNVRIIERVEVNKVELPNHLINTSSYLEFIDSVVSFLVSQRVSNVLVKGYIDPSTNSVLSYTTINQHVNFQMNQIKSVHWNLVYKQIGPKGFFRLLLTTNGYLKLENETFLQLFGIESILKIKDRKELSKISILYKRSNLRPGINLINRNSLELIEDIFLILNSKYLPKKFRKINKLLQQAISNDQKCCYLLIFNNIVGSFPRNTKSNFDVTTDISKVIIFCLTIISKVFPASIWGSCKNKTNIFRKIVVYIKLSNRDLFPLSDLLLGVKLTEIEWIGKGPVITSKQDHQVRKDLCSKFIEWVLSGFICKIIKTFWYVVESPSPELGQDSGCLLYFPHLTWNALTKEWFPSYKDRYLEDVSISSIALSGVKWHNFGRLRIIPKTNDFRVLCIPCKSSCIEGAVRKPKEKYEYLNYMNSIIRPTKEVLLLKLKEFYEINYGEKVPICHSIKDITSTLLSFKREIHSLFGDETPPIYSLKFDMKHCYDLLNQNKIIECLEEIFENDKDLKYYFIRQYVEEPNGLIKKVHNLIRDVSSLEKFNIMDDFSSHTFSKNSYITDRVKTIKLSKSDIFEVVKDQVFSSKIVLSERPLRICKRKQGIFQGFPLLATLCEVVYNALVAHEFSFMRNTHEPSILVRLADDFLALSTSKNCINEVRNVIEGPKLHKYGAFVNEDKLSYLDSFEDKGMLRFVGININIKSLTIEPAITSLGKPFLNKYSSFKGLFGYLKWYYKSRIKSYHLNLDLCAIEDVIFYVNSILDIILSCIKSELKRIMKRESLNLAKFTEFLIFLISEALLQFTFTNDNDYNIHILYDAIHKNIFKNLMSCKAFELSLQWLNKVL